MHFEPFPVRLNIVTSNRITRVMIMWVISMVVIIGRKTIGRNAVA